jgi:dipeptidyl-peptidase-4
MTPVTNPSGDAVQESYPRQRARTRGFQLGRPRSFHITDTRVLFIRSASGNDSAGSLWALELTPGAQEECVVDVRRDLAQQDSEALPDAERARRERMREVTDGITAFSVDGSGTRVVFTVSGTLFLLDLASRLITELPTPGPAVDPRIDAAGARVAFVSGQSLHVVTLDDLGAGARCIAASAHEDETWGLAEFIASEELSRYRGHWWLPGGESLLVERADSANVDRWWISDPANPDRQPHAVRYPSAGTANAVVELWCVDVSGARERITWDAHALPYVATVHVDARMALVELLSRDQRTVSVCRVDLATRTLVELARRTDAAWVDVMPGAPSLDPDGHLLEIIADPITDTYRLARDGVPVSPAGLQVRALLAHDAGTAIIAASPTPDTQALYRVGLAEGSVQPLTHEGVWSSGSASGDTLVIATAGARTAHTTFTVERGALRLPVINHAETPSVRIEPHYEEAGARGLRACILWPSWHVQGSRALPVVLSPYGGPHAQRVMRNAAAFATDQWLADQGFAVIVADGRGTPGRGPAWERAVLDDLATLPVEDQVDALQALGARHADLDLSRVGIRGWSFGGYLAALAVLDRPEVFHAAVAGAPVTDWQLYDTAYTERYLGDPATNGAAYARTSLLERASRLTRPLVLIHGIADDNVFVAHTLQLSSALLAAGRTHAVVPLSGVTHMTPQEVVAENLLMLEVDFFREHLGG